MIKGTRSKGLLLGGNFNSRQPANYMNDPKADVAQGGDCIQAGCWASLAEGYSEGNMVLHLHCNLRTVIGDGKSGDFCLAFKRAKVDRHLRDISGKPGRDEFIVTGSCGGTDEVNRLVPVVIRQTIQQPDGIELRRTILSVKRLLPLNSCLVFKRQFPDSLLDGIGVSTSVPPEVFFPEKNRELGVVLNRLAVLFGQPARQIIKGGAELVKGLSGMDAPFWRDWATEVDLYTEVAMLCVEIRDNSAVFTLNERGKFSIDKLNVFVSGCQLRAQPISSVYHGVQLNHERDTENTEGSQHSDTDQRRVHGESGRGS